MAGSDPRTIADLLKQIKTKLEKKIKINFNDYNLTYTQVSVLVLLMQNNEMKISDISEKLGLTNSTTSGIIDRLEKMELVKRTRIEQDRRIVNVVLTETFGCIAREFEERFEHAFAEFFRKASDDDLEDIVIGLQKLNRILDETQQDNV